MKKSCIPLACVCFLLASCSKKSPTKPQSQDGPGQTILSVSRIAEESGAFVETAVAAAFASDGSIDPQAIADSIATIPGVSSAAPTETGSGITVRMANGHSTNILLDRRDDERLFKQTEGPPIGKPDLRFLAPGPSAKPFGAASCREYPENKNAVILAPFQRDFGEDLALLAGLLRSAGYAVSVFENEEAGLNRFRSDSLAKYGAVLISTHGMAGGETLDGRVSTMLWTGERSTLQSLNSVTVPEMLALGAGSVKGTSYWAVSVPWLTLTLRGSYPKTWFYASGCETMRVTSGRTSLVEFLLANGAGGVSGYSAPINTYLADEIGWRLTDGMVQGKSLQQASDDVRGDVGLRAYAFYLRNIKQNSRSTVDFLSNSQRITEPVTLFLVQADFPYTGCRFAFSSRASFNKSTTGEYQFMFGREREVTGTFSNGVFQGTSTTSDGIHEDTHTIEIALDLLNHRITHFRMTGTETNNARTTYSIESKSIALQGNVTNGYFYANGTDVADLMGNVTYESTWTEAGGVVVTDRLTAVKYGADTRLEVQFN
jgi:hypothetical protein